MCLDVICDIQTSAEWEFYILELYECTDNGSMRTFNHRLMRAEDKCGMDKKSW
jgi:hypothetical protein